MAGQTLVIDLQALDRQFEQTLAKDEQSLVKFGRAAHQSSEFAKAGALVAAGAERDLAVAIEAVNAGTATAKERSRVLAAVRREEAQAARNAAEANRLAQAQAATHSQALGNLKSAVLGGLGPLGSFGSMLAVGGVVGVGLMTATSLVTGLGQAIQGGVVEIHEMELATLKMSAVFGGNAEAIGRMTTLVQQLDQAQPFFEDDQIAQGVAQLRLFDATEAEIKTLLPVLADMAAVMGTGLEDAVQKVGLAMAGNTRGLKQWGIVIKEGSDRQEILNAVLAKAGMFHDSAGKLAETMSGKEALAVKEVKNLEAALAQNLQPALLGIIDLKISLLQTLVDWTEGFNRLHDAIGKAAAGAPGAFGGLAPDERPPVHGTWIGPRSMEGVIPPSASQNARPAEWRAPMAAGAEQVTQAELVAEEARLKQAETARQKATADRKAYAERVRQDQAQLRQQLETANLEGFVRERAQAYQAHVKALAQAHGNSDLIARERQSYWLTLHDIDRREGEKQAKDSKDRIERAAATEVSGMQKRLRGESMHGQISRVEGRLGELQGIVDTSARGDPAALAAAKAIAELTPILADLRDKQTAGRQKEEEDRLKTGGAIAQGVISALGGIGAGNAGGAIRGLGGLAASIPGAQVFAPAIGVFTEGVGQLVEVLQRQTAAAAQFAARLGERAQGARLGLYGGRDEYGGIYEGRQVTSFVNQQTASQRKTVEEKIELVENTRKGIGQWGFLIPEGLQRGLAESADKQLQAAQQNLAAATQQAQNAERMAAAVSDMNAQASRRSQSIATQAKVLGLDAQALDYQQRIDEGGGGLGISYYKGQLAAVKKKKQEIVSAENLRGEAEAVGEQVASQVGGLDRSAAAAYAGDVAKMFKEGKSTEDIQKYLAQSNDAIASAFTPEILGLLKNLAGKSSAEDRLAAAQDRPGGKVEADRLGTAQNPMIVNINNPQDFWSSMPKGAWLRATGPGTTRSTSRGMDAGGNVRPA